jgi:uncharacterized protein with HEPN domain
MVRELSAYLYDIIEDCDAIEDVIAGVTLEGCRAKRSVRSSVEREFVIIGEALRRIGMLDSCLFVKISNSRSIVNFRNLHTHNYGAVNDGAVYGLIYSNLIVFRAENAELLSDLLGAS